MKPATRYAVVEYRVTNKLFHVYRTEQNGVEWHDIHPFADTVQGAFSFLYSTESSQL